MYSDWRQSRLLEGVAMVAMDVYPLYRLNRSVALVMMVAVGHRLT